MSSSSNSESVTFDSELSVRSAPYFNDHRIQGALVLPGTAYLEMVLAASAEVFGPGPVEVAEVEIQRAVFLPEDGGTRPLRLVLTFDASDEAAFRILSPPEGQEPQHAGWTVNVVGKLRRDAGALATSAQRRLSPEEIRARCVDEMSGADHYERMWAQGLQYGPAFRGIQRIWKRDGEALALVELPHELRSEASAYKIHPALLDPCLQALYETVPDHVAGQHTYVPTGVASFRIYGRPDSRVWSLAILRPDADLTAEVVVGDIFLFDDAGQVLVEASGARLQRLGVDPHHATQETRRDWLYEVQWQPKPRQQPRHASTPHRWQEPGSWLIFTDRGGVGQSLASLLQARGETCILVEVGDTYTRIDRRHYRINPERLEEFELLLSTVWELREGPARGVIHLWSLNSGGLQETTPPLLEAAQLTGCGSLLLLAKVMAATQWSGSTRLWVVTQGAQAAGPKPLPVAVAQGPVWGFGRVIALEHPEFWGGLVDLDPAVPDEEAATLLEEIWNADGEDQVAFRHGERYVARLVRTPDLGLPGHLIEFRRDSTYLVTGGLGDLGLQVAQWMVERGARRLVLLGRTKFPPRSAWDQVADGSRLARQIAGVRQLEALGATVWLAAVDVADEAGFTAFLEELDRRCWPPIRGIVHAAGVAEPRAIRDMDLPGLLSTLRPKVSGSWVLHRLTRHMALDFFVLFSSIASVWGSRELAHYGAANHFLDALAHHRTALGLPALSVNWGPWDGSGMAAAAERREALTRVGLGMLTPREALDLLGDLLRIEAPQKVVAPVNWTIFKPIYEGWGPRPLLAQIEAESPTVDLSVEEAVQLRQIKEASSDIERKNLLSVYIQTQIARVLGLEPSELDPRQQLNTVGLDSLMASQLKTHIENALGIVLPIVKFLQGPSVAELAEELAGHLTAQVAAPDASTPWKPVVPAPDQRHLPFPLTDLQQAYWIGRSGPIELSVQSNGYLEFEIVDLDLDRLKHAIQRVIERHDMMRAIIRPDGLQQILAKVPPYPLEVADLRGLEPQAGAAHLDALRRAMIERVTPADQWPLFELRVSRLDDRRSRFHIKTDLLLGEAQSLQTLISELYDFYENPELELEPLELSFRDYVLALEAVKKHDAYQRSKEYWLRRLPTLPPGPDLPLAKPLGAARPPHFVRRNAKLDGKSWPRLKARAARAGVTPSGVLLSAYAEVVSSWNKSPRFTIVVLFGNRPAIHPQISKVVANFNSPVLLAADSSQPTFEGRARAVQEQLWEDLNYNYFTGVEVLRELNRALGGTTRPLMPVGFSSHLRWGGRADAPRAIPWTITHTGLQIPQVYLDFTVVGITGEGDELYFHWEAIDELFPEGLVDDMFDTYCQLLQRLADDEQSWTGSTRRLLPPAQARLREAVNATDGPVPAGLLHHGFLEQAVARPRHVAVVSSKRSLTYEELDRFSTQVGHRLRALGARSNRLVAVGMEKGWEQVVAVLGVLKSGAAYLPIDPAWPAERIRRVLDLGEIEVALTQPWLAEKLDWPVHIHRVAIDDATVNGHDERPLEPVQGPEDLAYVIFTSGSTGTPKGVMIDHRGALNTITDINRRFLVGPRDRVLALSSLSFDLSVYDIFGTLAAGGMIVMPDAWKALDPAHWAELIDREHVTIWNSVPAMMEMLVEYAGDRPDAMPPSLRLVLLSGDWIPVTLPDRIRRLRRDVQLISLGGATEASIWSILYPIEDVDPNWKSIPYGKPMTNQRIYVLNEALEPCPVWVQGEIYIGGIGLAKGYWHDEEKTHARFILHPHTGERLYRTGDLGRYLPDGNVEFLGREDFQVKIRGFRIELGEIEAALRGHPDVRDAVVLTREDNPGDKRLVAYVVPEPGREPASGALQRFVASKLPEYMVPTAIVCLWTLPLTANGKVDRAALPAPEHTRSETEDQFTAPRTPEEAKLAEMFAQTLGLSKVGIHDNFFELGGHSLLAARLVFRMRAAFGTALPLSILFTAPTVARLARHLSAGAPDVPAESEPPVPAGLTGRASAELEALR